VRKHPSAPGPLGQPPARSVSGRPAPLAPGPLRWRPARSARADPLRSRPTRSVSAAPARQSPDSSAAATRLRRSGLDGPPIVERAESVLISVHASTAPIAVRIAPVK
jgi:hypothetical protein